MLPNRFIKPLSLLLVACMLVSTLWLTYFWGPSNEISADSDNLTFDHSYVDTIFKEDAVSDIAIEIEPSDWQWLLDNPSSDTFRSCNVTLGGKTFYNVGIKPKGNSSLSQVTSSGSTRYSLRLDFDAFVDGQTCFGMESIALNNMISDSTYMKEAFTYSLFDEMGVAVPEFTFANVSLNGETHGLFLALEVINETYMEREFGSVDGNLYKPETLAMGGEGEGGPGGAMPEGGGPRGERPEGAPPAGEMPDGFTMPENGETATPAETGQNGEMPQGGGNMPQGGGNMPQGGGMASSSAREGANLKYIDDNISSYGVLRESAVTNNTDDSDFVKIIEMMKSLSTGTDLEEHLDVSQVLKYLAVNTFTVNLDSYSGGMYHNYYLYEKDGVVQFLPWDLNMSFGGFNLSDASKIVNFPIDNPTTDSLENAPLIGKLLENETYLAEYHSYLNEIIEKYVDSGFLENKIETWDHLIAAYVEKDPTAFTDYEQYKAGINALKTLIAERSTSVSAQLTGAQPSTEYGTSAATFETADLGSQMGGGHDKTQKATLSLTSVNSEKEASTSENSTPNQGENQQAANHTVAMSESKIPTFDPKQQNGQGPEATAGQNTESLIYFAGLCVALLAGLAFVTFMPRKKYMRKS